MGPEKSRRDTILCGFFYALAPLDSKEGPTGLLPLSPCSVVAFQVFSRNLGSRPMQL